MKRAVLSVAFLLGLTGAALAAGSGATTVTPPPDDAAGGHQCPMGTKKTTSATS